MRQVALFMLLSCLQYGLSFSQCENYYVDGTTVFHANNIRTHINTAGEMFWYRSVGTYQVPYSDDASPSAIYAGGVWIGGYDTAGDLKLAAQTFRSTGAQLLDFSPGPLTEDGMPYGCSEWDTIWSVTRYEILSHVQDFVEDGVIDNQLQSIYGWPGSGNPFFFTFNEFSIPEHVREFAPFYDANQDGVYRPDEGDYPLPYGFEKDAIPDQITWHVFHDAKEHKQSWGEPLHVEIQQTCYAFYCNDENPINQTLFMDFHVVNRNGGELDSVFFALWLDPDIGCASDDHIGCAPEDNVFFAYNSDATDGDSLNTCDRGVKTYSGGPPVLSGVYFKSQLSSFLYYNNAQHPYIEQPRWPLEYYRLLTGLWADGQPLTVGGDGYNPGAGNVQTKFAFDGEPKDSNAWSMIGENLKGEDRRIIPSTSLGTLDPGQVARVSMALTLHVDPGRDHVGNVSLMYDEVPMVKSHYSSGFNLCSRLDYECMDACVWPGDANKDGIANHRDLLILGLAHSRTGPVRIGPLSWTPHNAENWEEELPAGINFKFADTNGDGVVEINKDSEIIDIHYGMTHDDYQSLTKCNEGQELIVTGGFVGSVVPQTPRKVTIQLNTVSVDSLYGLAFSVLYDRNYFWRASIHEGYLFPPAVSHSISREMPGRVDFAVTRFDGINDTGLTDSTFLTLLLALENPIADVEGNDTTELCIADARGIFKDGTEIPLGANRIKFIFLEDATDVSDMDMQSILVYPNPSTGLMHFAVPSDLIGAQYEVKQISGQLYFSKTITDEVTQLELPEGVFVLNIRGQDRQFLEKIVVLE